MNTNKKIIYVLILPFLCITVLPQIPISGHFENRQVPVPDAAYTPHAPIEIDGDGALATFCNINGSGSGTSDDPYVIENLEITGESVGISIKNTFACLCIKNNNISVVENPGIHIEGARNVNISHNLLDVGQGISIYNSYSIIISGNSIINPQNYGISCVQSFILNVLDNIVRRTHYAITFQSSNYIQANNNTIEDCRIGCSIMDPYYAGIEDFTFENNIFTGCGFNIAGWVKSMSIDTSNKVNGKSVRYYENETGISLIEEKDVGQLILVNVNNSEFRGLNVMSATLGILCLDSHYNTFSNIFLSNNYQTGIHLVNSTHNSITMNKFEFSARGICLYDASDNKISGNLLKEAEIRLLGQTHNNIFTNNNLTCCGFNFDEIFENFSIDTSNKVNGKSVRYYENKTGISLIEEKDVGQLLLVNVNNSEFRGFNLSYTTLGVLCLDSHYNVFSRMDLCYNSYIGMHSKMSTYNIINSSRIQHNGLGLSMYRSNNNTITGNLIRWNDCYGIELIDTRDNRLYNNAFIHNGYQAVSFMSNDSWDDGAKGNYWGDYTQQYPDATANGTIWDTPYSISDYEFQFDYYPLVFDTITWLDTPNIRMSVNKTEDDSILIKLEWDPIEDAESYLVYTSESPISESDLPGLTPISEGLSTSLMQSLKNGTYYYVVVAVAEWMASNTSISNVIQVFIVIHPKVVESTQPDEALSQDCPNPEQEKGINGYQLAMIGGTIGIIGVIALVGKRRRIET